MVQLFSFAFISILFYFLSSIISAKVCFGIIKHLRPSYGVGGWVDNSGYELPNKAVSAYSSSLVVKMGGLDLKDRSCPRPGQTSTLLS